MNLERRVLIRMKIKVSRFSQMHSKTKDTNCNQTEHKTTDCMDDFRRIYKITNCKRKQLLPFFGKPRRPLLDFRSWCLSFGPFMNKDSAPFCTVPFIPSLNLIFTPFPTLFALCIGTSSFESSTADVDLLRTRIFFEDAVGIVSAELEEGELAIFLRFQGEKE